MDACKYCRACLAFLLTLTAACGGGSPTAPTATPDKTPGGTNVSELRITGLPRALSPGSTTQLKAETVLQTGTVNECAATWSVDEASVASVSSSGLLTGVKTGYVSVTASCEGLTTRAETKVEAVSPYNLVILVYDTEVRSEVGVATMMEFLDGPRAGQSMPSGSALANGLPGITWPVKVRFTADGFEPTEFILSESTGQRRNPMSNLFDFSVPMKFVPDALTDTYVRRMSRTEMEIAHPFTMRVPGPVQIRTWWSVDYNDRLFIDLWCDGKKLRSADQAFYSAGGGFTHDVLAPGACEVRLRQLKSDAATQYRVAIRYPR